MLPPLLENVLQTIDHFKISCLRASFSWLEKPRNQMGQDLIRILCSAWKKRISISYPMQFLALPIMKKELWSKKFQSDQWSAAHFQEVGGAS
jgi:hypothetical protein